MGALSLFRRTSSRRTINLASWHSPHSLTWSWILALSLNPLLVERPRFTWSRSGPHVTRGFNVGTLFSTYAMRNNGGWQFGLMVLGVSLNWSRQQPMWYRDLYQRQRDRQTLGRA